YRIPVGDAAALERHAQNFRLYDPRDPRRPEKLAALQRMHRVDLSKYHDRRPFDFSDPRHLREVISCLRELAGLGMTTPAFVLYLRAKLGLYTLFHQMEAKVECHKVLEKYV
ncbi:MAG TPA: hypothetical protein VEN81_00240, partial [Planctomycetota bacterium]|nr:hypothetical protein [Planctomycetota bacterium]